ncbi:MAG: 3-methyl-2-oxobutanoate hydroxymethyltransferase [Chloroflexota bacterium]|nr:3-methyl-2-oxobutanoate hydroxymethyltransferase [Chloroflexota bacterium]MDE2970348.1 3-methyl-2-oxobutanoate hydroxymethyltransferase [Chloroflexota bacterium]
MRVTTRDVQRFKAQGERFPMLTAYDFPTARLVEEAGVPVILVGDSLGMVVLGHASTIPVTMEVMLHHTTAVVRGTERAMVVADMPFLSYNLSGEQALGNAGRFLQEAGAQAVKLEGGVRVAETVRRVTEAGVPVMGHIGLTPQAVNQFGGYRVQGKTEAEALALMDDAVALQQAGAFCVVLELVPDNLAKSVTERLAVPTVGIGAGPHCDGQVQVIHDLLGFGASYIPKHARRYADVAEVVRGAVSRYAGEVREGRFPDEV